MKSEAMPLFAQATDDVATKTLDGTVQHLIFRNEANGYTVLELDAAGEKTVFGIMPDVQIGDTVQLQGSWKDHPVYGPQFAVQSYVIQLPTDSEAILKYLASGAIRGIGEKTARRLVDQFGSDTLRMLEMEPEQVARLRGVGQKRAADFARQLHERKSFQGLAQLLTPLGFGLVRIARIHRLWGLTAVSRIRENPYELVEAVAGIGFDTADRLARQLGHASDGPLRVCSAAVHVLLQNLQDGHTWMAWADLLTALNNLLGMTLTNESPSILALRKDGRFCHFTISEETIQAVALTTVYDLEIAIPERLKRLTEQHPNRFGHWRDAAVCRRLAEQTAAKHQLILSEEQLEAIIKIMQHPFTVITGGPGTGKTTLIRVLVALFAEVKASMHLAAPTGRAARRISEATGHPAKTIHRLLALQAQHDATYSGVSPELEVVPLKGDLLVVDEMSMVDLFLFEQLLRAIPDGMRVVLIGDVDQLPAIGPGQILHDLLATQAIPQTVLRQIYRQEADNLIIRNAYHIRNGEDLEVDQSHDSGFLSLFRRDDLQIAEDVLKLSQIALPREYQADPLTEIQILSPMRRGPAGTEQLNQLIQQHVIPASAPRLSAFGRTFAAGDKVIQTRNQYEWNWQTRLGETRGKGIMNGETGIVLSLDHANQALTVLFEEERIAVLQRDQLEDLELAYAITVHKSQGSEYRIVVLVLTSGPPDFLTRNLLYTAVTRAREKIVLVGRRAVLQQILRNHKTTVRKTLLARQLRRLLTDGS